MRSAPLLSPSIPPTGCRGVPGTNSGALGLSGVLDLGLAPPPQDSTWVESVLGGRQGTKPESHAWLWDDDEMINVKMMLMLLGGRGTGVGSGEGSVSRVVEDGIEGMDDDHKGGSGSLWYKQVFGHWFPRPPWSPTRGRQIPVYWYTLMDAASRVTSVAIRSLHINSSYLVEYAALLEKTSWSESTALKQIDQFPTWTSAL